MARAALTWARQKVGVSAPIIVITAAYRLADAVKCLTLTPDIWPS